MKRDFIHYIEDTLTFMKQITGGHIQYEILKLQRIYNMIKKSADEDHNHLRKDFAIFIDEHDRRYGTNFLKVFPEYEEFYYQCKELS